jgi:ankyrin repeat protein
MDRRSFTKYLSGVSAYGVFASLSPSFGSSVPKSNFELEQQLGIACAMGELEKVQECLEKGVNVNSRIISEIIPRAWVRYRTPLYLAAKCHHLQICRLLIRRGADVNAIPESGDHILQTFLWHEVVQFLVEAGASVNPEGLSVLSPYKRSRSFETFKFLVEAGADINAETYTGNVLLDQVAFGDLPQIKLLLNKGARLESSSGMTALQVAERRRNSYGENLAIYESLMKSNYDVAETAAMCVAETKKNEGEQIYRLVEATILHKTQANLL